MLGQNYFIRKAIARCPLALHHSHDVKEQSVLAAILASNELPVMARTRRQNHHRGTSAMAPAPDVLAAMSDFERIPSALPPGSDVADTRRVRGLLTQPGHSWGHEFDSFFVL